MKRVRCPKCENYITFDETKYTEGQSLVFQCPECNKQFGIRIGVSKLKNTQKEENRQMADSNASTEETPCGSIVVIENVFHYKVDPSVDLNHCTINVSRNKQGRLKYILRDNNSNTGTFVENVEIPPRERRVIESGTLFTIGATSIILKGPDEED